MRRAPLILLALAALALALALAGCGSGGKRTLPTAKAESMLKQLDKVGDQFDNQACNGAIDKVRSLESQARALPSSVDAEVQRHLVSGLNRLEELVAKDCQRPTPTNTTPTNTTPTVPTTPTNTVPTTPTNTVPTTPTNTTPTNTVPTTPTTPGGGGGVTVPGGTTGTGGTG